MDHFDYIYKGDADHFENVSDDDLLSYRDLFGDDALSIAVRENKLKCVEVIYRKCPKLLYCETPKEHLNALHHAVIQNNLEILKFLIAADVESQEKGAMKRLTRMPNATGYTALMIAIKKFFAEAVKLLVTADPDFHHPLNESGQTPLMWCMSSSNMQNMFKLILERSPDQSKTPMGPKGSTILHHAASRGDKIAIKDILRFCLDCAEVVDNKGQNFLHIATQFEQEEVVRFCVEYVAPNVLNGQDNDGNTPLTIAASKENEAITLRLLTDPRVDIKLANVVEHLHWAVRRSCFQILKFVSLGDPDFSNGIELDLLRDSKDEDGESILSKVVQENDFDLYKLICTKHPSLVYHQSRNGKTSLHHAAWRGAAEMVKFLITKCLECNAHDPIAKLLTITDEQGDTALHLAVSNHEYEAVKLLIEADNKAEAEYKKNKSGETPLSIAIKEARSHENNILDIDMFKLILERSPDQSKTPMGPERWTILHHAASRGDKSAIEYILQKCPDCAEVVNNKGQNFLHIATQFEQEEVVRFCVEYVAPNVLNGQDNDGNTPLTIAASKENEAITLRLLTDPRVDIKLANVVEHLHWAVRRSCFQILKFVSLGDPDFSNGIELDLLRDSKDEDGESILSKVVQENDFDLYKLICTKHPSLVYHQSRNGKTSLHHAAWRGAAEMVKFLITKCLECNAHDPIANLLTITDEQGDTALHLAVSNHEYEAVKLLIEADNKAEAEYKKNKSGETPLSIAIREARSHENNILNTVSGEIRKLLLEKYPSQFEEHKEQSGWTLLHDAAYQDDFSTVLDIIKLCPDRIELVDNRGMNFLHVAAMSRSIQVVKHVLASNKLQSSVLNKRDEKGNTPLHHAALSGDEDLTLCFLYNDDIDKRTTNHNEQKVLDAVNFDYDKRKAGVLDIIDPRDLKDQSEFDLVVGALIATVSFTAGITVPGGYITEGPKQGTAVLSKKVPFEAFVMFNTFALLFSLYAVFSHYCTRRLIKKEDVTYQMKVATHCTLGAIYAMMAAFIAGSLTVLENRPPLAILVCVVCSFFYIFSARPMWKLVMQDRSGSRRVQTDATAPLAGGGSAPRSRIPSSIPLMVRGRGQGLNNSGSTLPV